MSTLADYCAKAMELSSIAHNLKGVTAVEREQLDGCALDALKLAEDTIPKPAAEPGDMDVPARIEAARVCVAMRVLR